MCYNTLNEEKTEENGMTREEWRARLRFREMGAGDEERMRDFFGRMSPASRALFDRRSYNLRGALKFCEKGDPTRRYWLALEGEELVGYVFFLDVDTSIPELGLAVREDLQGQHLGEALIDYATEVARALGKGGIQLTTHVANLRGQVLYEKMGFVCRGSCKNGSELFYLYRFSETGKR